MMNQVGGDSNSIRNNANGSERVSRPQQTDAPEEALTHFSMRLAMLEKTATGLGTLGFIWATVVLLGGFAITLDTTDFWFITIILVIEGTRIFSRSHELEWQHQATWSNADAITPSSSNFIQYQRPTIRGSNTRDEENQPSAVQSSNLFLVKFRNLSKVWYWLQLLSAITSVVLSMLKLIKHNFGDIEKGDTDKRNRRAALFIFYWLVLAEASLFIMEKVYWEWTAGVLQLLENVNDKYQLGPEGMVSTRRFFYDAYSKSINGSVFDSLRMDMVSFAVELLNSNSPNEQLIGARLLRKLSTNDNFSPVTLRKIGVDIYVVERLVEMLNWRNPNEQEIRESAAAILEQVASQKQNSLRIAEIPGAVESVASLLRTNRTSYTGAGDEICQRGNISDQESRNVQAYNFWGLRILYKLSRDHDNCGKIGNTRGLLPKIIDFTYTTEDMFRNPNPHITTVSQSLKLVKKLVSSTGITGGNLRKEISEIVFTIGNVRNILKNGENHPKMQLRGIQVLTNLGLEDDATEKIGGTGGVLRELLTIFFKQAEPGIKEKLRNAAGDAIAMLTLESKNNCHRVLRLEAMDKLVNALKDEALCINTARILRNLHIYTDTEDAHFEDTVLGIVETAPTVLKAIMKPASNKQQEVMTGLALHVFKYMTHEEFNNMLQIEEYSENDLAAALVNILKNHLIPSIKVPRIRRFAIELAIWMMREWKENAENFKILKIDEELEGVIETTTDVENFHLFSGTVGVSRHDKSLHTLADEALSLVAYSQT